MIEPDASPQTRCADAGRSCSCGAVETMEARALRRLAALEALADMGGDLARLVHRQAHERADAETRGAAPGGPDLGLVFARIARAVRQTWALHDRFDRERQAREDESEAQRAARVTADIEKRSSAQADMRLRGAIRMNTVREALEGVLDARVEAEVGADDPVPDELNDLYEALDERLTDPKDKDDFADLPISQLIARVCRDLGVVPDWNLWADEEWAHEETEARTPGSPYAAPGYEAAWPEAAVGETHSPPRPPTKMESG